MNFSFEDWLINGKSFKDIKKAFEIIFSSSHKMKEKWNEMKLFETTFWGIFLLFRS